MAAKEYNDPHAATGGVREYQAENNAADASMSASLNAARGLFTPLALIGIVGLLVAGALGGAGSTQASGEHLPAWGLVAQSYVYGYFFWLVLSLGCLGVQILTQVIRPTWGIAILRVTEAGAKNLRYLFFLGLPLLAALWFGDSLGYHLYPWTSPAAAHDPILVHKLPYLNQGAVTLRYLIYFAIWCWYNWALSEGPNGTHAQDKSLDNALGQWRVNVASPGFVIYVISITFFFTDLVMSLDPHWFSTIYGVWWGAVSMGAAIALGTIFVTSFHAKRPYSDIVTPAVTKDLGNMMFAFTMIYGYFSVSQVLIYWSGNLPEYVSFYYARFKGPLAFLGFAIVLGQFFTPFLLLLSGKLKRTPSMLRAVAIWILCVRAVDVWYQLMPFFGRTLTDFGAIAVDLAAWAFVGGVWVILFIGEYRKHAPLVLHDQRMQELKANEGHH